MNTKPTNAHRELLLWLQFKAEVEKADPGHPPCPFCGINHQHGLTHPFCDMVARFKLWRAARDQG